MHRRNRRKYLLYVRRANGHEKATDFRMAIRITFYKSLGKPYYVMVQHGFPNIAICIGRSKREVQQTPLVVSMKIKSFRKWASEICRRNRLSRRDKPNREACPVEPLKEEKPESL